MLAAVQCVSRYNPLATYYISMYTHLDSICMYIRVLYCYPLHCGVCK